MDWVALSRVHAGGVIRYGDSRTIMVWQETLFVDGCVVRRVVISLDATWNTATVLTCPEAGEVANAILRAARLAR